MKIARHLIAAYLVSGLLIMSPATNTLADESTHSGLIKEISSDHSSVMVNGSYYQIDRRTVVHAPIGKNYLSLDKLTTGTQIGFRTDQPATGSTIPRISEIWIYLD